MGHGTLVVEYDRWITPRSSRQALALCEASQVLYLAVYLAVVGDLNARDICQQAPAVCN